MRHYLTAFLLTAALIGLTQSLFSQSLVTSSTQPPDSAVAMTFAEATVYRQSVRRMPLLERPYRLGHFVGNTARRRHHRHFRGI